MIQRAAKPGPGSNSDTVECVGLRKLYVTDFSQIVRSVKNAMLVNVLVTCYLTRFLTCCKDLLRVVDLSRISAATSSFSRSGPGAYTRSSACKLIVQPFSVFGCIRDTFQVKLSMR